MIALLNNKPFAVEIKLTLNPEIAYIWTIFTEIKKEVNWFDKEWHAFEH